MMRKYESEVGEVEILDGDDGLEGSGVEVEEVLRMWGSEDDGPTRKHQPWCLS